MKRAHIFFSGYVQGVGFRYTARAIAIEVHLKGWVKNLSDGRVEVVCEGDEDIIKSFLDELKERFSGYIDKIDITWEKPTGEFVDFKIRF